MPFLALFTSKKERKQKLLKPLKSKGSKSTISQDTQDNGSESPDSDYVVPPSASVVPTLDNVPYSYSHSNASQSSTASKFKLPFRRKSSIPSSPLIKPTDIFLSPSNVLRDVDDNSRSSLLLPLSSRISSVISQDESVTSVRSQAAEDSNQRRKSFEPIKKIIPKVEKDINDSLDTPDSAKSGISLLGRVRERRKSKPTTPPVSVVENPLEPSYPKDSFNLKSFRHVGPEPPSIPPLGDALISPLPSFSALPIRPRENSVASDTSQKISVAAFREAQARRSSTNLAGSPGSPSLRLLASPSPTLQIETQTTVTKAETVSEAAKPFRLPAADSSSSDEEEEEESDSDEGSPSRSRPPQRLSSQRTITPRTARTQSELGHRNPSESITSHHQQSSSTRSESGHELISREIVSPSFHKANASFSASSGYFPYVAPQRRTASQSMSELGLSPAAVQANAIVSKNMSGTEASYLRAKSPTSDTSGSNSNSSNSSTDSDNAPLALYANPPRTDSPMSMHSSNNGTVRSRTGIPAKPLVDLKMPHNPINGKPSPPEMPTFVDKQHEAFVDKSLSPTNISSRLAQLAANLTAQEKNANGLDGTRSSPAADLPHGRSPEPKAQKSREEVPFPSAQNLETPKIASAKVQNPGNFEGQLPSGSAKTLPDMGQRLATQSNRSTNSGFSVVSRPKRMSTEPLLSSVSPPMNAPLTSLAVNLSSNEQIKPTAVRVRPPSTSFSVMSRPSTALSDNSSSPPQSQIGSSKNVSSPMPMAASFSTASSATLTSLSFPTQIPQRPFANQRRQESPASSTGGSSTGRLPLTPKDGSDYFSMDISRHSDAASGHSGSSPSAMKGTRGHPNKASVTFEDNKRDAQLKSRGRPVNAKRDERHQQTNASARDQESRRRERRREEAKKSIELGNVINGSGPIVDEGDDQDFPTANAMGPRMSMLSPSMIVTNPINNSSSIMGVDAWQFSQRPAPMMPASPSFMLPQMTHMPMGTDRNFLMAHQQAMLVAKQAYQMAVAQQAMAAAANDWERGSNVSGFTGGYPGGGGMGMGMPPPGWGGPAPLFSPSTHSFYGSSAFNGSNSPGGWASASVYGEAFGPATTDRRSQMTGGPLPFPRSESVNYLADPSTTRNGPRVRTKTAPSNTPLPPQHSNRNNNQKKTPAPPSSWKTTS